MKKGWVQQELYLKRIRPFYDSELIKVITGIRRCGKSILLKQIRQKFLETGIEPERITYLNFEEYTLRSLQDPDTFHAHVVGLLKPGMKHYLLCDEIQNAKDFELVVNSLRSTSDVSIFLTGSNARLLSGELATHLGGRTISLKMMSFSFSEFCTFSELPPDKSSLNEYMKWGGFPLVCSAGTEEMKYAVFSNLYDSIVLKDIIMQSKVSSAHMLDSPKTIDREFGAFKDIEDNYPKYVISYDDWRHSEVDGIIHLPLLTFLTGEQAIR